MMKGLTGIPPKKRGYSQEKGRRVYLKKRERGVPSVGGVEKRGE